MHDDGIIFSEGGVCFPKAGSRDPAFGRNPHPHIVMKIMYIHLILDVIHMVLIIGPVSYYMIMKRLLPFEFIRHNFINVP